MFSKADRIVTPRLYYLRKVLCDCCCCQRQPENLYENFLISLFRSGLRLWPVAVFSEELGHIAKTGERK